MTKFVQVLDINAVTNIRGDIKAQCFISGYIIGRFKDFITI